MTAKRTRQRDDSAKFGSAKSKKPRYPAIRVSIFEDTESPQPLSPVAFPAVQSASKSSVNLESLIDVAVHRPAAAVQYQGAVTEFADEFGTV